MMYKNNNGVLFIPTLENNEKESDRLIIKGVCITIADNIRGKYHGHLILSDYESPKNQFSKVYFNADEHDYKNVIDLVFSIIISDERR